MNKLSFKTFLIEHSSVSEWIFASGTTIRVPMDQVDIVIDRLRSMNVRFSVTGRTIKMNIARESAKVKRVLSSLISSGILFDDITQLSI